MSPSAVTRLVAALEERLGARLLQRTTRSVTLTDIGVRYLERIRRVLTDVEEAEGSVQQERTRPSGRLVVSAPIGFGRLHVSPVMSAYLTRYSEVSAELRLSDRMINLVEQVDSRSGSAIFPISAWSRAMSARCAGSWSLRPAISANRASPAHRKRSCHHPVRRRSGLALCQGWSRTAHYGHAAICHQQRRRGDLICRAGWGTDAGDGDQAADLLRAGRLRIVLAQFEQPALPIHIVYPTSRLLSAKVRSFIDLVVETSDWHFGV